MPEEKNKKRKTSEKKHATARYKWLKVVWHKIDELEERLNEVERAIKLINEKLGIVKHGESNGRRKD